jgi:hypothetical protein
MLVQTRGRNCAFAITRHLPRPTNIRAHRLPKLIPKHPGVYIGVLNRLTISEALRIAEQQVANAEDAKQAGEPDGEDRVQQWSDTLYVLNSMKGGVCRNR